MLVTLILLMVSLFSQKGEPLDRVTMEIVPDEVPNKAASMMAAFMANVHMVNGSVVYPTIPPVDQIGPMFVRILAEKSALAQSGSADYISQLTFTEGLRAYSHNNTILLAMVDDTYIDMAVNLYKTSIQPYDIKNYFFVSLIPHMCHKLIQKYKLPCSLYDAEKTGCHNTSSYYCT